jgi:hypothetical protein
MKKLLFSLAVAGMFVIFACGPSEAEKAEQARLDSIRIADSLALEQVKADSIAQVEKAQADSIAAKLVADSIEAAKGGKKGK